MFFKTRFISIFLLSTPTMSCVSNQEPVKASEMQNPPKVEATTQVDSIPVNNDTHGDSALINDSLDSTKLVSLYDGKLKIRIPRTMQQLDSRQLAQKYPKSNPPEIAFANDKGSVNIAFRYNSRVTIGNDPAKLVQMMSANLKSAGFEPTSNIESINGREFAMVEFVSNAYNAKLYNKMAATVIEGRVMICTFNCTTNQLNEWKAIGETCLKSIQVKG